jgi:hypothetical protein
MDGVYDVVHHPDELAARERQTKALRHETSDSLHGIAEAEWVCRRGILGEDTRGDQLPASELRHDVDEGESESAQVLPGRVRSQVDGELALQLPEVKVEDLVALQCADPQST